MKKLLCLVLALALLLTACSKPKVSEDLNIKTDVLLESGAPASEIVFSESFPAFGAAPARSLDYAETLFLAYFGPMAQELTSCGEDISAEAAFAAFERFIIERGDEIANRDELTLKLGEKEYYSAELLEGFAARFFGISAEEMRSLKAYDPENSRYERLDFGAPRGANAALLSHRLREGSYYCEFTFDGGDGPSLFASMEYENGDFRLKSMGEVLEPEDENTAPYKLSDEDLSNPPTDFGGFFAVLPSRWSLEGGVIREAEESLVIAEYLGKTPYTDFAAACAELDARHSGAACVGELFGGRRVKFYEEEGVPAADCYYYVDLGGEFAEFRFSPLMGFGGAWNQKSYFESFLSTIETAD